MRWVILIGYLLILITASQAQPKPVIVGQKNISTLQGKPVTIHLSDLSVEEHPDQPSGGGQTDDKDDTDGDNKHDDDREDEDREDDDDGEDDEDREDSEDRNDDEDRDEESDSDQDDDDRDEEDDDEKDREEKGNGNKDDKKDKGKDKDKDKDKDKGKDKDKNKGKGNNDRTAAYPTGYSLQVFPGQHYTVSGATITPNTDFTGELTVEVQVSNAKHTSSKYPLNVSVNPEASSPVNIPPVITGQTALKTPQGTPLQISLSHLEVSDPDDEYPQGFSLALFPGKNYALKENTVIPDESFIGQLEIPATVTDGKASSEAYTLKVTVNEADRENVAPRITGQVPLSISVNQSVKIVLTHLIVVDPDNAYPQDFSLNVYPGEGYSLDQTTVRPPEGYAGELVINVTVNDGKNESGMYPLKITVVSVQNQQPVITGQTGVKIAQGKSLRITFSHLVVRDPDSAYPGDFTLHLSDGDHYHVSNHTITPISDYLGVLTVPVTVHDGKVSSDPYLFKIEVVATDRLEITGQQLLEVPEDSSVVLSLADLTVNDPSGSYPTGFTLHLQGGDNYEVLDQQIIPHSNFFGNLTVTVTISGHGRTSEMFSLLVVVHPVNDAPELLHLEPGPIVVSGEGSWLVTEQAEVWDADDDHLLFAEIGFSENKFHPGMDVLHFDPTENIQGIFDMRSGILFLLGRAPLEEYQRMIRSVQYGYSNPHDSVRTTTPQKLYLKLNDGKTTSAEYERAVDWLESEVALEIPTAFTPNNDQANDTWKITPMQSTELLNTTIRVYDRRGNIVFESMGLDEWDGLYNGDPLPADVYFYTIELDLSHRKVSYKGIVSILR